MPWRAPRTTKSLRLQRTPTPAPLSHARLAPQRKTIKRIWARPPQEAALTASKGRKFHETRASDSRSDGPGGRGGIPHLSRVAGRKVRCERTEAFRQYRGARES